MKQYNPFTDMRVPQSCTLYGHPLTRVLSWHSSRSTTHSLAPRFTEKWKARLRHPSVPPEALPPALKRKFDTANENKERYRRATGRQSMVHAPSPAEKGAGLNPGSMPRKIRNTVFGGRPADRAEHGSPASAKVVPK